ncbi:hypothetical protein D9611_006821 [Ephemerocybe angulata]|uniref:Transmembrane protein 135 N-terminal domain-containing protein n=1 Tax=Ephemerocybe angulata TaxID=980116 RepID=A0A8H5B0K5_9AGAR|nr:hypothetical protein D9611_006821 [Tulosesus angulatus]
MESVQRCRDWLAKTLPTLPDDPTHPAQVALRTYALALSFSLGPALVPFVASVASTRKSPRARWSVLRLVLKRELGYDGFAASMTTSVAGGAILRALWCLLVEDAHGRENKQPNLDDSAHGRLEEVKSWLRSLDLTPTQVSFACNIVPSTIGVLLLQKGANKSSKRSGKGKPSPTLDLTLLLVIRALDSLVQSLILRRTRPSLLETTQNAAELEPMLLVREKLEREETKRVNKTRQRMAEKVDAFLFWACSSRIMWCWFYEPYRLPQSYVKWITAVSNLDERIPEVLRLVRTGEWSYLKGSLNHSDLLHDAAKTFGLPTSWGDPTVLPAYGGAIANETWKQIGVTSRPGVGGLPCEMVHGRVGKHLGLQSSCHANATLRFFRAFAQAFLIYGPVHLVPVLLTRPRTLLRPAQLVATAAGALRSTAFLASFISLYYYTVCLTRTLVLARLLPFVSHDFWDGPYGCALAGSLTCGASIWIENGRRRGEMALYVLPRALRTCLPGWMVRSQGWKGRLVERIAFIVSMSTLLTSAVHRPDSLRGLSRWGLAFIMNGPNAGFWKRKRRDPSIPLTPSTAPTPYEIKDFIKDQEGETIHQG